MQTRTHHRLSRSNRLVLTTLKEYVDNEPNRKCFRLIGGVLVERTVKDVAPALKTNRDGVSYYILTCATHRLIFILVIVQIMKVLEALVGQYKNKEEEFTTFTREHGIQRAGRT